jgi:hypothetical protein
MKGETMRQKTASQARQKAIREIEVLHKILKKLVAYQREIIQGKTTQLRVQCGRRNCRCARGEKHIAHFLYVARGGPLKRIWIPKKDLDRVKQMSERYGRFRAARAEINKSFKKLLAHIDELEAALTVPYKKER